MWKLESHSCSYLSVTAVFFSNFACFVINSLPYYTPCLNCLYILPLAIFSIYQRCTSFQCQREQLWGHRLDESLLQMQTWGKTQIWAIWSKKEESFSRSQQMQRHRKLLFPSRRYIWVKAESHHCYCFCLPRLIFSMLIQNLHDTSLPLIPEKTTTKKIKVTFFNLFFTNSRYFWCTPYRASKPLNCHFNCEAKLDLILLCLLKDWTAWCHCLPFHEFCIISKNTLRLNLWSSVWRLNWKWIFFFGGGIVHTTQTFCHML